MSRRVLIAIPARDEVRNLAAVVAEVREARPADEVLVIDDGSEDGTARLARELGCRVLRLPLHLGYGAAVQAGVKYGLRRAYDVIVTFDGDGQHDARDIEALVAAVAAGAELVLGSRVLAPGAYQGALSRQWGRRAFSFLARRLTGLALTDPTSGMKALGPAAQRLFASTRFPDRFPDADALVLASRARLAIAERPARMRPSRNLHSMHDGLRAVSYTFNMLFSLLVAAFGREADLKG
jgi:glycosyltransferase involved in cell wall biosynthesis